MTEENQIDHAVRDEALRRVIRSCTSGHRSRSSQPSMGVVGSGSVPPGTMRTDLLSRLGEPTSRFAVTSGKGVRESFVDSGEAIVIRPENGKAVKVR